jgi:hypothetical protein
LVSFVNRRVGAFETVVGAAGDAIAGDTGATGVARKYGFTISCGLGC